MSLAGNDLGFTAYRVRERNDKEHGQKQEQGRNHVANPSNHKVQRTLPRTRPMTQERGHCRRRLSQPLLRKTGRHHWLQPLKDQEAVLVRRVVGQEFKDKVADHGSIARQRQAQEIRGTGKCHERLQGLLQLSR